MQIIDVRSKEEFDEGHLAGAINIDVSEMSVGKLPEVSKDTSIMVYCRSGGRSSFAKHILETSGFTDVTNGGGYESLKEKEL